MSRSMVVFLAVGAAVLLSAGSASAQLCANVSGACNSYFFAVSATSAPDVFAINGFEYGCGQSRTRHASGVIRSVAGSLQVEFTGTNENFDFSQGVAWSGQVANPGLTGTYKVLYSEISGGVFTGHGATGAVTVAGCAEPALPQRSEEKDTSQQ